MARVGLRDRGCLMTGSDLLLDGGRDRWWPLAREPLPLESSCPGVFVDDNVRYGSVKRVAPAVGEGAMAVKLVHRYLALGEGRRAGQRNRDAAPVTRQPRGCLVPRFVADAEGDAMLAALVPTLQHPTPATSSELRQPSASPAPRQFCRSAAFPGPPNARPPSANAGNAGGL